jgi:hypothetical protein
MWYLNMPLLAAAVAASLSGIYFLFLPVGGFQGGRNPWYGVTILFSRGTWDDLHTWSGVMMIAIAAVHLLVHRAWIARMARRAVNELCGGCGCLNRQGRINLAVNAALGVTFIAAALSGLVLLFTPHGRQVVEPVLLWSRGTWDDIHTWSATFMIIAAISHIIIHWGWLKKVTTNMVRIWRVGGPQAVVAREATGAADRSAQAA